MERGIDNIFLVNNNYIRIIIAFIQSFAIFMYNIPIKYLNYYK